MPAACYVCICIYKYKADVSILHPLSPLRDSNHAIVAAPFTQISQQPSTLHINRSFVRLVHFRAKQTVGIIMFCPYRPSDYHFFGKKVIVTSSSDCNATSTYYREDDYRQTNFSSLLPFHLYELMCCPIGGGALVLLCATIRDY